jgi:uncharacterized protein (TIGR00251 family)
MPGDRRADSRTAASHAGPAWLRADGDGVLIFVHLQPGARRTGQGGEHGGRLKVAVAAPPLDGRANDALVSWVAERLGLTRRQVSVTAGLRSRDKTVRASCIALGRALRLLAPQ